MKKTLIISVLIAITFNSFSQQTNNGTAITKQDYLQKSKKQKKAALLLLGGGATLVVTGIIFPKGESKGFTGSWYGLSNAVEEFQNDGIKHVLVLSGCVSMLGSIPFFISSGKNKKRVMNVSLKNEMMYQLEDGGFVNTPVPSLTIKVSL